MHFSITQCVAWLEKNRGIKISKRHLQRFVSSGYLPAEQVDHYFIVKETDLRKFVLPKSQKK